MPHKEMNKTKKGPLSLSRIHGNALNQGKLRQSHLPKGSNSGEESPFDNVLRNNDFQRAERLVSIPKFLHDYPPRMSLDDFIAGKEGDAGFSPTLCLFIESGIYNVTANFLMHVLEHFSSQNILQVLKSMQYEYLGSPKKVIHYALRRATRPGVPENVSLEIIQKLLDLGFDLNSLDDMNQSAIFYFVQGEDSCWTPTSIAPLSEHYGSNDDIASVFRLKYHYGEYKFKAQIWHFLVNVKQVKLNLVDKFQDTPLSLAVKLHRKEIISKLVTEPRFVEIGLINSDQPPFHLYCEEGILCPEVFFPFFLRLHIIKGLSIVNYEGKTALHCLLNNPLGLTDPMALIPYIKKFKELKEAKIFMAQDKLGNSPLMTAICHSYPYDILKLLILDDSLKLGALSLSLKDNNGFNALALALNRYKGGFYQSNPRQLLAAPYSSAPYVRGIDVACSASNSSIASSHNGTANSNGSHSEPMDGEAGLHKLIEDLAALGVKLDQQVISCTDDVHSGYDSLCEDNELSCPSMLANSLSKTQSILSVMLSNKYLSHRTISLCIRKGLFKVSIEDIAECSPRFRLDILYELMKSIPRGSELFKEIASHQSMPIEILNHVYDDRRRYLNVSNNNNIAPRTRSNTNGNVSSCNASAPMSNGNAPVNSCQSNLGENDLSPAAQELALENLNRVCPLLRLCFDYFGHDINFTLVDDAPENSSNRPIVTATVLHTLILVYAWLPLQPVVDYIFGEKGHLLDTEIFVEGSGTPLNHAIHNGQFYLADKLLDLNADCSKVDLKIPVIPLKRGFSHTIKRMIERGARLTPEFGQQMKSITTDSVIESEYNHLMSGSS